MHQLVLSNEQFRALVKAIVDAFDQAEFDSLLQLECGRRLDALVGLPMPWGPLVTSVVRKAEMQSFTDALVLAVAAWRPRNVALAAVLRELSAMPGEGGTLAVSGALRDGKSAAAALEGLVRGTATYTDVDQFLADLAAIAARVCRVENSGAPNAQPEALGTGFLVGDDLVLTNQHVRAGFPADPSGVACRFDYRALAGSVATRAGTVEKLHIHDWMVAEREHAAGDTMAGANAPLPEQLDYALLRLSAPVGRYARGRIDEAALAANARGHFALAAVAPTPQPGDVIFVLQHPGGAPMKLAVGRVLPGAPAHRIWHDAPTEGGTSGSPCFNQGLKLVAMHHATDAAHPEHPTYNQAVPIELIAADLLARGRP